MSQQASDNATAELTQEEQEFAEQHGIDPETLLNTRRGGGSE